MSYCAVLAEFPDISSCVHFAGLKAVGESVSKPLLYYDCNIGGTVNLLEELGSRGIKKFVFSSSATVYGEPEMLPLVESARLQATNPYGRTKLFIEEILRDCHASDPDWNVLILRVSLILSVMLYMFVHVWWPTATSTLFDPASISIQLGRVPLGGLVKIPKVFPTT